MKLRVQEFGLAFFITTTTVVFLASLVLASDVYLLVFLAILCGVLLAHLAEWLGTLLPVSYRVNLAIVVMSAMAATVGIVFFFGWRIENQIAKTSDQLDQSFAEVERWLEQHPVAQATLGNIPFVDSIVQKISQSIPANRPLRDGTSGKAKTVEPDETDDRGQTNDGGHTRVDDGLPGKTDWSKMGTLGSVSGRVMRMLGQVFSTTFGVTLNVAFVLVVGVFFAIDPVFYRQHLARLFPPHMRQRVESILTMMGDTLFQWLQGRAAAMAITGTGTAVVLWLLGVPLALTLGIITGLLTFIPSIGSLVALFLSILVALSQGPVVVVWVVVLYAVLQFIESNMITPIIQQRQTSVPPPLLLSAQLLMAVLTGFLGVLVATPLVAVLIVLIREAYVHDFLEGPSA